MTPETIKIIEKFKKGAISSDQSKAMEQIRDIFIDVAKAISEIVPEGDDKSTSIRYLRMAAFLSNNAIMDDWVKEKSN